MLKYLLVLLFIFTGCSVKMPYTSSQSYFVVIKNSQLALADTGFIRKRDGDLNLQLFSASTPVFDLHVKDSICVDLLCLDRESFNQKFFGYGHYNTFVDELFNMQPIYNQTNIVKNAAGFEQKIKTQNYDIIYRVANGNLYFKDKQNRILIKIKELK